MKILYPFGMSLNIADVFAHEVPLSKQGVVSLLSCLL